MKKIYSKATEIPFGKTDCAPTAGCLLLEGGAWRGLYTEGVLDALLEEGIIFQTTIGVSAGAMSGMNYVSGQIGRSARFNLTHRFDSQYTGIRAFVKEHGVTGFHYLFEEMDRLEPFERETFFQNDRTFIAVVSNCVTGKAEYYSQHDTCDIFSAIQASATVPYVSQPVMINGIPYLDGGISEKIPLDYALEHSFDKIIIVRTRDRGYRKPVKGSRDYVRALYGRKYPAVMNNLLSEAPRYNILCERIDDLENSGRLFVIAPETPLTVSRFETDLEKIGQLYWQGYYEMKNQIPALRTYLSK